MATTSNTQNQFDFNQYNQLIRSANSGLRLHLAIQLLADVEQVYRRFDSPFAKEMIDLVDEVKDIQRRNKEYLAKRNNAGTSSEKIDNENKPTSDAPVGNSYQNKHGDKPESHVETPAAE